MIRASPRILFVVHRFQNMGQFTNLTAADGFVFSALAVQPETPKAAVVVLPRFWRQLTHPFGG
jgi:hypothetical protein